MSEVKSSTYQAVEAALLNSERDPIFEIREALRAIADFAQVEDRLDVWEFVDLAGKAFRAKVSSALLTPQVEALIRWRDSRALDWDGDELVSHVLYYLDTMPADEPPPELQAALQEFQAYDDDTKFDLVQRVVDPP